MSDAKAERFKSAFLAFREQLFGSSATEDEKKAMWSAFINIYTGTV